MSGPVNGEQYRFCQPSDYTHDPNIPQHVFLGSEDDAVKKKLEDLRCRLIRDNLQRDCECVFSVKSVQKIPLRPLSRWKIAALAVCELWKTERRTFIQIIGMIALTALLWFATVWFFRKAFAVPQQVGPPHPRMNPAIFVTLVSSLPMLSGFSALFLGREIADLYKRVLAIYQQGRRPAVHIAEVTSVEAERGRVGTVISQLKGSLEEQPRERGKIPYSDLAMDMSDEPEKGFLGLISSLFSIDDAAKIKECWGNKTGVDRKVAFLRLLPPDIRDSVGGTFGLSMSLIKFE